MEREQGQIFPDHTVTFFPTSELVAHRAPILLVPGFLGNKDTVADMAKSLTEKGYPVCVVDYNPPRKSLRRFIRKHDIAWGKTDGIAQTLERLKNEGYEEVHVLAHSAGAVPLVDALLVIQENPEIYPSVKKIAFVSPAGVAQPVPFLRLVSSFAKEGKEASRVPEQKAFRRRHKPIRAALKNPWYHMMHARTLAGISLKDALKILIQKGAKVEICGVKEDSLFRSGPLKAAAQKIGAGFVLLPGRHNTFQVNPHPVYADTFEAFYES